MSGAGLRRLLWAVGAVVAGAIFLFPLAAMVAGSLREPGLPPPLGAQLLAGSPSLEAYARAFEVDGLARALLNSLIVAGLFVPISVITASWAGYAMTRLGSRARRWMAAGLLVVLVVPASALWVPRFAIYDALGLTDSYVPLILPAFLGASPLLILLYALAFRRLPRDVLDAARVEGAGELHAWRTVAMPLVRGTTIAAALLAFALSWGNFIDPLLYLSDEDTFTAPLALRAIQQLGPADWSTILAAAAIITLPVAVAFTFAMRRIAPREGTGWLSG